MGHTNEKRFRLRKELIPQGLDKFNIGLFTLEIY